MNTKHLKVELTNKKSTFGFPIFRVIERFTYQCIDGKTGYYIDVPEGFETDFATVPRIFWSIFPPVGEYATAAVLHDYMYRQKCKFDRAVADAIFYQAMKDFGVPKWKAYLMFKIASTFGGLFFNKR